MGNGRFPSGLHLLLPDPGVLFRKRDAIFSAGARPGPHRRGPAPDAQLQPRLVGTASKPLHRFQPVSSACQHAVHPPFGTGFLAGVPPRHTGQPAGSHRRRPPAGRQRRRENGSNTSAHFVPDQRIILLRLPVRNRTRTI